MRISFLTHTRSMTSNATAVPGQNWEAAHSNRANGPRKELAAMAVNLNLQRLVYISLEHTS